MISTLRRDQLLAHIQKKIRLDQDLNVFYFGGSGGFIFLHWILLAKKHYCALPADNVISSVCRDWYKTFKPLSVQDYNNIRDPSWPDHETYIENFWKLPQHIQLECQAQYSKTSDDRLVVKKWFEKNLSAIINKQWKIQTRWKDTEHLPFNTCTVEDICQHKPYKIYFTCNHYQTWQQLPGKKIFLYTDIRTQLRMSHFKQAWCYHRTDVESCKSTWQITKSMLKDHSVWMSDKLVYDMVPKISNISDHTVCLHDFLLHPEKTFGKSHNQLQKKLLRKWARLHPRNLLTKVGFDSLLKLR